ncbi:hypothetical protein AMIS_35790 [Actinoplanes missouriensis 431]|uniref:Uncharacterized protein n=1 Tax=Actinoplanes missouriensis (strain ATCC 14538 / DSM 43046 / CBS 188.64 / JCM 3121 / NBRC 102363 / NCIMB 12654 / NRRL B-3342 / UNCC 431) TaxID=512565 RepID=I0H712_ACTM4|nr:hypothetical protein [Actinoplanes missouriensis]BAL88799.1 hypothetical protein AMIS_35790 [Actinoplanes missouriensis 431]
MNAAPVASAGISIILLVLALPALLLLANPRALRDPRLATLETVGVLRRLRTDRSRRREQALEALRYAAEVRVATERAHHAAQRWQDIWRQSEEHVEEAWQAWQNAEDRLARTREAAAFPTPHAPQTPTEYADREQSLHRMLQTAAARGDLPTEAVVGGHWDPRLHPVEQELQVHRAIAAHRHRLYRQAVAAERAAWHDAQLAVATRDSLRREWAAAARTSSDLRIPEPMAVPARLRRWAQRRVVQRAA